MHFYDDDDDDDDDGLRLTAGYSASRFQIIFSNINREKTFRNVAKLNQMLLAYENQRS